MGGWENTPSSAIRMDPNVFIFASVAVLLVGLVLGTIELLIVNRLFARFSFFKKILFKFLLYSFVLSVIIFITFMMAAAIELQTGIFDSRVWNKYLLFFSSYTHLSTALQMTVSLVASLLYTEISDNIGHGVLLKFFTGKYHSPVQETRIFMFLDMKASTTIAEQLGHQTYFKMLKAYYADISDAIVRHGGEIYQYVGDEIIVSWKLKDMDQNANCIRCFFAMKADLQKHHDWYRKKFGVMPEFKAGIHPGEVTTGEIGLVKKDIMFTGDVLNATARIQGLCNEYGVDLLVSGELLDNLQLNGDFTTSALGSSELRGRKEHVELFTIRKANDR